MMMTRTNSTPRLTAICGAALFALSAGPLSADVKTGVDAWSNGDFSAAVKEWQLPAQNGDADAIFNLAQAYRLGRGVPEDMDRAKALYAEAAQKGHVKAADNYGLLLFQLGERRSAMPLIRAASDRGDPRAQYVMGLSHFNADYAEKDWVRAYALLTLANAAGLPQAQAALTQMDGHIPIEQRQKAQIVAREIEAEASNRRAADLAALDLGQRAPVAAKVPAPATAPTQVIPAPKPQPKPVAVAEKSPVPASNWSMAQPAPAKPQATPAGRSGNWKVQLGAFGVAANADRLWSKLAKTSALSGTTKVLVPSGKVTRLQAKGFADRAEAQAACDALSRQGQACIVTAP